MNFKHCELVRDVGDYVAHLDRITTWLPEEFAKVGKVVDLKMPDGWEPGWKVSQVFTTMPEEYVREHERDYKTQAEASDKFTPNKGLDIKK